MEELEQVEAWLLGKEEAAENESWVAVEGGECSVGAAAGAQHWEYLGRRVCGIALAIRAPVG